MRQDDAEYYRRRALQEQQAAKNADSAAARQRHDEFATMYRFRAAVLTTDPELRREACSAMATVDSE